MSSSPVAVIDIGSNSIKLLVAALETAGRVTAVATRTLEARIGTGLGQDNPQLTEDGMQRGLHAIRELLATAAPFSPARIMLVATSAVRDTTNGRIFRERVHNATGHEVRILSGQEEASLIGRGLICDPALAQLRDFYVFDLGGGSLECLAFGDRRIQQAASLPLGCVRLTEQFVRDPARPLPPAAAAAIAQHVTATLAGQFRFSLVRGSAAAGTGGTITTFRAILAARAGVALESTSPRIDVAAMQAMAIELGALPLTERQQVAGLPPARADVFPTALITLGALAAAGGIPAFQHSFYNLRFGLAAEAFGAG